MIIDLCDDNFVLYAMKSYERPNAVISEFEEDIKRIKYIKRLLKRYSKTGNLKERLILNHIIILANVFGVEATTRMLFLKIEEQHYEVLKTFLLFLNFMPRLVSGINGKNIDSRDITVNLEVAQRLRAL